MVAHTLHRAAASYWWPAVCSANNGRKRRHSAIDATQSGVVHISLGKRESNVHTGIRVCLRVMFVCIQKLIIIAHFICEKSSRAARKCDRIELYVFGCIAPNAHRTVRSPVDRYVSGAAHQRMRRSLNATNQNASMVRIMRTVVSGFGCCAIRPTYYTIATVFPSKQTKWLAIDFTLHCGSVVELITLLHSRELNVGSSRVFSNVGWPA